MIDDRWWLIAQRPPSQPGGSTDLELVREVSREEVRQTRAANGLLNRLANMDPYSRLVDLYQRLEQSREVSLAPAQRTAEMNRAAQAMGRVARELGSKIRQAALEDFDEGSAELQALDQAIIEETERPEFRFLITVGELGVGPFAAGEEAVQNDAEAVAALVNQGADVKMSTDLISALRAGVVVAQRLIGRQLQLYEGRIAEASLYLRHLAAEVTDGAAALMKSDTYDPEHDQLDLGQVTFDPLALGEGVYLHRALRRVYELLEATTAPADDQLGQAGEDQGPESHAQLEAAVEDSDSDAPRAIDTDVLEGPEDPTDAPPGNREDQVLDLRALVEHATDFTDELERAWSSALDGVLLGEAQAEMNARYSSLLHSIQRRVAAGDRSLRDAGFDPTMSAYPPPAEELSRLALDPNPEQRWRQLQLAELEALMLLLEALEALRAPSGHVIVDDQPIESWWEAGAFSLVRDRAHLLVRISEQVGLAETALREGSRTENDDDKPVHDRLRLANRALGRGDIEASLLHSWQALRLRVGKAGLPTDDLAERLANDTRLADVASILRLLEEAVQSLGRHEVLDVGCAMILAPRALAAVNQLCLKAPEIIEDALGGQGSDGK